MSIVQFPMSGLHPIKSLATAWDLFQNHVVSLENLWFIKHLPRFTNLLGHFDHLDDSQRMSQCSWMYWIIHLMQLIDIIYISTSWRTLLTNFHSSSFALWSGPLPPALEIFIQWNTTTLKDTISQIAGFDCGKCVLWNITISISIFNIFWPHE